MSKKIYILDDNVTLTSLMDYVLRSEGFEVKCCNHSEDAIDEIKVFKPDLILLDWLMPNISGKDILDMIKNNQNLSNAPIFLLTGLAENLSLEDYLSDIKIIEKPFDHDELIKLIKETLCIYE